LYCALAVWCTACGPASEDTEAETPSETDAATDTDTDTGAPSIVCVEDITEEECSAAVPEDTLFEECTWFPAFAVTGDGVSCSFEPAGGVCGEVGVGGTGCFLDVTSCGMVIGKTDDTGNMILARVPDPVSCAFTYGQDFELCYGPQDGGTSSSSGTTGDADTNVCECACAEGWPG